MTKKTKKILFVEFLPTGGSAVALLNFLGYMNRNNRNDLENIVVTSPNSVFEGEHIKLHFKMHTISYEPPQPVGPSTISVRQVFKYLETLFYLTKICLIEKPDIIYTNHHMWSIYSNVVGFIMSKPVIINICDVWPLEPKLSRILMKFNKKARYIAVSKYVYQLFVNRFKVPKNRTTLIYDGVDDKVFYQVDQRELTLKQKRKKKRIIYFSRITPERDIEIFIDTAAHMLKKYPDLSFYHYGYNPVHTDSEYFFKLKNMVDTLGLGSHFKFKKYLKKSSDVASAMRKAYLTLIPARQFAIPNVAIESMMCGTPVIANKTGGNPEIIIDDSLGILVDANLSTEYVDAIELLLNNNKKYVGMANRGSENMVRRFHASRKHSEIIKLINRTLDV